MQRKALKQLGKVTQWTNEKVFSGEKTQLSSEFTQFEKDIDIKKNGIERLHAVSEPYYNSMSKRKPTADPMPPSGSAKDKIPYTEAMGLVMIDYGDAVVGAFGDSLAKYGRARCRMAGVQEEFANRLGDGYMNTLGMAQGTVDEYKSLRKKLDSRRLALDAAISKLNGNKKGDPRMLEEDVELARARFEEVEEECVLRGEQIAGLEQEQYSGLTDLLEAELEYFAKCKEILEELRDGWPSGPSGGSTVNRPRAKSNASNKSFARGNSRGYSRQSAPASDDDEGEVTPNRSRSQSNASTTTTKSKRTSMLPSFGSFGRKSGLATAVIPGGGSGSASKRDRERERANERRGGSRMALHSEEEDDDEMLYTGSHGNRNRSGSTLSASVSRMSLATIDSGPGGSGGGMPPRMRRTNTAPTNLSARYMRAKHEYAGGAADELPLRVGQVIEVKSEVNDDWYIGESEGMSGLFPASYCEVYKPNPVTTTSASVTPPARRSMPPMAGLAPPATNRTPSPSGFDPPSDTDFDSHGYEDADHYATAALSSAPQANPTSRTASPALQAPTSTKKKAPPPPPPSRRSQSSSNILSAASSSSAFLAPPASRPRANTAVAAAEASPFGGSEDEAEYLDAPSPSAARNGLGAMHLGRGGPQVDVDECNICGCDDFTQNTFKSPGTCSTCFHNHI